VTATNITQIKPWHESLADWYIQNPTASNRQTAKFFNVSEQWVSIVKNSDGFKELMKNRREAHRDLVSVSVINKVEALAEQAIDELADQMGRKDLPVEHVKDIAAMSLKAMGFGGDRGGGAAVTNNVNVVVDRDALLEARAKLISSRPPLIESTAERKEEDESAAPDGSPA
jgi:hypothetical protein